VSFTISKESAAAILAASKSGPNFVEMTVSGSTETIELIQTLTTDLAGVVTALHATEPRFSVFRYDHRNPEDQAATALLFIYTNPDNAAIKQRMLCSSTKTSAMNQVEALGANLTKRIEVGNPDELTADYLELQLYPPKTTGVTVQKFAKPAAAGKGGARLNKK